MADIFKTLHAETKAKILGVLKSRVESAIENNEDLHWDSLLSRIDGFTNLSTGKTYRGFVNSIFLAFTSMVCDADRRFPTFPEDILPWSAFLRS